MSESEVTKGKAEELLLFLPNFSDPDQKFITRWNGLDSQDGSLTFPHPEYEKVVIEFFKLAAQECWSDYSYNPEKAGKMLEDDHQIERADMGRIKTMLTYSVRMERFFDGHWASILEAGRIQKLLIRMQQLVPTLPDSFPEKK